MKLDNLLGVFEEFGKWFNGRPQRLKEQALKAAETYIEINENNLHNGEPVPDHRKDRLLKHYKKQFYAWRDGV